MKQLGCLWMALLLALGSMAQEKGTISATLLNEQSAPLEGATAELFRTRDTALVKTALSDAAGKIEFMNIPYGDYVLRISTVGFQSHQQTLALKNGSLAVSPIKLQARAAASMQNVTVSARKPFIQRLNDRIVVNVENSIVNAGTSAMDVLERSPGITVDQNDVVSLRGKAGVIIMIDGKPSPMTGADLANYLKGLPSNAIERIEIITNPSARYDASGNSGIIDIRMKKDQRFGTNGTLTAGYGQGLYPKANGGLTFNYRNKSMNWFGNYNFSYRKGLNHLFINRNFFKNGVLTGSDDKDNFATMPIKTHTARLGADFFPSQKTIIGFVVNGNFNHIDRLAEIGTTVNNNQNLPAFRFQSVGTNDDNFKNLVANVNFKHQFAAGKELTADVDWGQYRSSSITRTSSFFYNLNGTKRKEDDILDGDQQGTLSLKSAKVDYTQPLGTGKLEVGGKTSYVKSDNNAKFFNVFPAGPQPDLGKTNQFLYEEYNYAAYVNASRDFKKLNVMIGLRGEQTSLKTRQVKGDTRFNNNYFQLFPSAFVNYKLNDEQTLGASVSRRIDRPGYSQLNPFLFQIDATIYSTGQPLLRPQTTWSYELSYTRKNINFTLGYSRTTNPQNVVLSRILDVIPNFEIKPGQDSNITVQIPVNLQSQDYFGLTATAPVRLNKWWNLVANVNVFYNHFNGNLGGTQLNNGNPAANIKLNNNFNFSKGWSAELSGNVNTGGRYGYMVMNTQWSVGAGIQKTLFAGKGTIRLNVSDIFWTSLPKGKVTYEGSYVENWHAVRDTRVGNLSFTYRFGSNKVQQARKRTTASEEERQRASN